MFTVPGPFVIQYTGPAYSQDKRSWRGRFLPEGGGYTPNRMVVGGESSIESSIESIRNRMAREYIVGIKGKEG